MGHAFVSSLSYKNEKKGFFHSNLTDEDGEILSHEVQLSGACNAHISYHVITLSCVNG